MRCIREAGFAERPRIIPAVDLMEEIVVSENTILDALSVDNVKRHVEHIVNEIPSRLAGSENGRRMAEYSCESLRRVGVDAKVISFPGLVSFPHEAECRVIAPTEIAIQAN